MKNNDGRLYIHKVHTLRDCKIVRKIYCPFRGCARDWVKLGVAKRHGAVLGDAVSKMADKNTKVQLVESDIPGAELPES